MVLTACRVWRFEQTGEHTSKTDAGTWALARDPSLTGVERALSARTLLLAPQIAPRVVERVLLRVLTTWPASTVTGSRLRRSRGTNRDRVTCRFGRSGRVRRRLSAASARPSPAADPGDSEYIGIGESGRADRRGGTQR